MAEYGTNGRVHESRKGAESGLQVINAPGMIPLFTDNGSQNREIFGELGGLWEGFAKLHSLHDGINRLRAMRQWRGAEKGVLTIQARPARHHEAGCAGWGKNDQTR